MATMMTAQLRCSTLINEQFKPKSDHRRFNSHKSVSSFKFQSVSSPNLINHGLTTRFQHYALIGGGGGKNNGGNYGGGGDGSYDEGGKKEEPSSGSGFGIVGMLLNGWRDRVAADPQFPFKVLMEELVGVSACMLGDMASRPNFGLNELDFVFSTLVVGSILNFTLMYLLAPTLSATSSSLPSMFANCPTSHMFEPGAYSLVDRLGTCVYKGAVFAAVGFAAGLVGTAISNGLIIVRKKMDPEFETPNKPPPTILNASTWAAHMGVSSNLRYQTLNGIEFLLAKVLPPLVFKSSVVVLRMLNNVLGGMSFVALARVTGSQPGKPGEEVAD
ncbi:protein RETICULATA-RELATED 3, chloroplastic-like [Rutidosis leptorrhynchoides]|uniref:protein RETICULATA-RELATED 3, chloroplastic-like n=1 Tax=Rutidosis leptorrhynchoides TaxID=125765 RepID=UPI003A99D774